VTEQVDDLCWFRSDLIYCNDMGLFRAILLSAFLITWVLLNACGERQSEAIDNVADPSHSFIPMNGTTKRELPIKPTSKWNRCVGYFIGDQEVGVQTFYTDGKLYWETVMGDAGTEGLCRTWHSHGVIATAIPFHHGLVDGRTHQWNEKGQLLGSYQMVLGTGIEVIWYENGTIFSMSSFVDGKETGLSVSYSVDGGVSCVHSYTRGVLDGPQRNYYPSNALQESVMFRKGRMIGPLLRLDQSGTPLDGTPIWYLDEKIVSHAEYDLVKEKDPSLP
jgi:antitoxin component YwqK of YwqJK toxin-antitoxin module